MVKLKDIVDDESRRRNLFPVAAHRVYMAHAGVSPMPQSVAAAMTRFGMDGTKDNPESPWALEQVDEARKLGAALLGAEADEIALLGPTSVGLSLVAAGLPWETGDEVVYYGDDYPANVYPWASLASRGVKPIPLRAPAPGVITWEAVEAALTGRTRLVALASCHYLSGYRIDIDGIGRQLHDRGVLFCVDGIQTLGAFPTRVDHVDFLSADSHKWLLGPLAAGLFFVSKLRLDILRPMLLGAWNVDSPDFVAQPSVRFHPTARRYEPGAMNFPGIAGMTAAMRLLLDVGIDAIAARLLELRRAMLEGLRPLGYRLMLEDFDTDGRLTDASRSAIVSVRRDRDVAPVFARLTENGVVSSFRRNKHGDAFVRLSPHFYNTFDEVDKVVELMR